MTLTLQELSDREEIRETIMRWSRAVDTQDWNLLDQSCTPDVDTDFASLGIPKTAYKDLRTMLMGSYDMFKAFHHILSNTTYHEVTAEKARASTLVTATNIQKNGTIFETFAWYHDELRRTKDGWRIVKRGCEKVHDTASADFENPALKKFESA